MSFMIKYPIIQKSFDKLEVKNYQLNSPESWKKVTKVSKEQYEKRVINLPPNTRQKFILDLLEQYLYRNPDTIAKDFATISSIQILYSNLDQN